MKVDLVPIDKIIPYSGNAKAHPEAQIKKLAAAIAEFGWDQPIVVDKDMVIIKGHARRLAAIFLGLERVPVIVAKNLTPAQVRGARLADNKMAEGEWYPDLLSWELQELAESGFDLDLTGFADFERDEIMGLQQKTALGKPGESSSRNLYRGQQRIKVVLAVEDVAVFEQAIKATGEMNRGRAVIMICEAYLGGQGRAKGQFDPGLEDFFKA